MPGCFFSTLFNLKFAIVQLMIAQKLQLCMIGIEYYCRRDAQAGSNLGFLDETASAETSNRAGK